MLHGKQCHYVLKENVRPEIAQWYSSGLTGWMIGRFETQQGLGIFLFTTASRLALGPSLPPIQWVPGAVYLGVKRSGCEADHSPQSSAEVKNEWNYTSTPHTPTWRGA
jgi:hypothetical protein